MGNNEPFRDVDYMTSPITVGPFFDCAKPINDSIKNTGLTRAAAGQGAGHLVRLHAVLGPGAIPAGGGLAPMGGPFYKFDAASTSDTKFPPSYDGKAFYYDWAKNRVWTVQLNSETGKVEKVNRVHAEHVVPGAAVAGVRAGRLAVRARVGRRLRP